MKRISVRWFPIPEGQAEEYLKEQGVEINEYARKFFRHPSFRTGGRESDTDIAILSLKELGLEGGGLTDEIFGCLEANGLKPCRPAAGLYLRLAWRDQLPSGNTILTGTHSAPDSAVTVFCEPPEEDDSFPKGLYLRNVGGTLWLRGYVCDATYRWSEDDLFAFEMCR